MDVEESRVQELYKCGGRNIAMDGYKGTQKRGADNKKEMSWSRGWKETGDCPLAEAQYL